MIGMKGPDVFILFWYSIISAARFLSSTVDEALSHSAVIEAILVRRRRLACAPFGQ